MSETVPTADGSSLAMRAWPVCGRGVVAIVHGYGEHGGRYDAFARWLNDRRWSVVTCDLRGHGRSPGRRGHLRRFADYLSDAAALHRLAREHADRRPVFLLGHSLGGLIATRYAQSGAEGLAGIILSAPFFGAELAIPRWKTAASRVLSRGWPSLSTPNGLTGAMVSRDPQVMTEYETDPLIHKRVTARWFTEVLIAQRAALNGASQIELPLLVLHGDADPIASVSVTRHFFADLASRDQTLKVYSGFLHEVLNEIGKERVWDDIAAWLDIHEPTGDGATAR